MNWFDKKKSENSDVSSLPELPAIPEFPKIKEENKLPRLPTYPVDTLGEKFSQSAIKDAVSGKKEVESEVEADEFGFPEEERMQMMQKPLRTPMREINVKRAPMTREISDEMEEEESMPMEMHIKRTERVPKPFEEAARIVKKTEPVFVRIDKFEESLKTFEEAKRKISEIEKLLRDINKIKEDEEKEINDWQNEIQLIKKKIDKVDQEIFSKIE